MNGKYYSLKKFPSYRQLNTMDCGPACLKIISRYYGKYFDLDFLRQKCGYTNSGTSIFDLANGSEEIGLRSLVVKLNYDDLYDKIKLPCIIHWNDSHFVVLYKIKRKRVYISDPAIGLVSYNVEEFLSSWYIDEKGVALVLETTPKFNGLEQKRTNAMSALNYLFSYLNPYKTNILQLLATILIVAISTISLPFITQAVIDIGVNFRDYDFITVLLIASISLLVFNSIGTWVRSTLALHMGSRIKISLVNDYVLKLLSLPINFFETQLIGDIIQRAKDQERIQTFITQSALSIAFSFLLLIIFGSILFYYNSLLFWVFLIPTILYIVWVVFFYNIRKKLDIKYYELLGKNQSHWLEMLTSMEDIKINRLERTNRSKWETIQNGLYKTGIELLNIDKTQQLGADFINGLKNVGLTFLTAKLVIDGQMSFGMMISVQFIIGQLNSPTQEIIRFIQSLQMAYISFMRINQVNSIGDEQNEDSDNAFFPKKKNIILKSVSFRYTTTGDFVLKNISLNIEENKTTAIVGASGSGKTTLLKLLLGLYKPSSGKLYVGDTNLENISLSRWRDNIGVVLQESKVFNDTILNNIVCRRQGEGHDRLKLEEVLKTVNLVREIESLPKGINTMMGEIGKGLSQGQKQRILIARALYKNPEYLFLDEATNSLDSLNENIITKNLSDFFENKTVVIVAHRLSTIMKADTILVLNDGFLIEKGSHEDLYKKKGLYYTLFKTQMNYINEEKSIYG